MSTIEKLYERLRKIPPPKDFKFEQLITLLTHFGCSLHEQRGGSSHKYFIFNSSRYGLVRLDMAKPHPSSNLKPYQIKAALLFINKYGII
ncbi:type II toxin-antitoxin system HicA family toxin [Pelistega suis]|uniref:type II toxin-antitoxin system HicA family toxin n=1 Tax=Pelistega suis TaxID=1631957 RepID=UPI00211C5D6D|nr:type II toxin-antitoxin system HicA family toxin [Pelistega suis]MCQ9328819.1 type II toxin-antitoxin system HicA family toxin [Pelistega suis]MDY3331711.1 type II toxin-antitoxin system HicA family toxin [Pelistega sp.]